jgi:ABC-2 type transport system ATP-binding protein
MSPRELLALAASMFNLPRAESRARAMALLERFGLGARARDAIATLSGGMRRRLEMARALLHDPDLLLLDEPTTGVDPGERRALWDALLYDESRRRPRTILLATNDMAEADGVCDVVTFLKEGRAVACGSPAALKRGLQRESVTVTCAPHAEAVAATVRTWPGVGTADADGDCLRVTVDDASAFVPRLFEAAPGAITGLSIRSTSLEDAYFHHIGERAAAPEVLV